MELQLHATPQSSDAKNSFEFTGAGSDLFLVILRNLLLSFFTAGIYYPWARTNIRRFIWNHTSLDGIPFEYHGTGEELFRSYIKVLGVYVLFAILSKVTADNLTLNTLVSLTLLLSFLGFIPFAVFGIHSYRITRTSYRGLRFHVDRSVRSSFVKNFYLRFILSYVTLGLYFPFLTNYIWESLIKASSYGDLKFDYKGRGGEFFWLQFTNFIGIILTLGLFMPWAILRKYRYLLLHTTIDSAKLHLKVTGMQIGFIGILNVLLVPLTLGLAYPFVQVYSLKALLSNLVLDGNIDLAAIKAAKSDASSALGETGGDVFDVDMGI